MGDEQGGVSIVMSDKGAQKKHGRALDKGGGML